MLVNDLLYNTEQLESVLHSNRIWKQRLIGVGIVPSLMALNYGFLVLCYAGRGLIGIYVKLIHLPRFIII